MPRNDSLLSIEFKRRLILFSMLLAVTLCPEYLRASATVTASKDCTTSPCTVVEAQFTLLIAQAIQWQATYTGSPTDGHSFYLSTVASNMADIALTTSGQGSGAYYLNPGTYHISIRTFLMGPGFYSVTYNPSSTGETHITTFDGRRYDFQGVGEFVLVRQPEGQEIQTRQAPIPTTYNPGPDPYDQLAMCVSINTAVAARVGKRRVTYEPNLSGVPDPSGLQLRVDGAVTTLGPDGLDLGSGGRLSGTSAPGGLEIDFPDRSILFVTPSWWNDQKKWYLNYDMVPTRNATGLAGNFGPDSWLPALPDGTLMGPMPRDLHDRYVGLYQKFADAWRVTNANSLFDYASGTSSDTFTNHNWPPEHPPCTLPGTTPAAALSEQVAKQVCQSVTGENARCVYDVMVTGNAGFATTYALGQSLQPNTAVKQCNKRLELTLLLLLLLAVLLWLLCVWRHRRRGPQA